MVFRESDGERLAARHSSFSQSTQPGQQDASLIKEAEALSPPPMTPVDGMATFAELELGEADAPSNNGTVEAPSPSEARSPGVVFASTALDRQIHANMPPWITEWRLKSALCSRVSGLDG